MFGTLCASTCECAFTYPMRYQEVEAAGDTSHVEGRRHDALPGLAGVSRAWAGAATHFYAAVEPIRQKIRGSSLTLLFGRLLLVYQMPKTGSQTVEATLEKCSLPHRILRFH